MDQSVDNINRKYTKVEGVAGAGKTTKLINDAKALVENKIVDQKNVLLMALTTAAVREIEHRTDNAITARTAHSFCWRLLREQHALNRTQPPTIVDAAGADRILLEAIDPSKVSAEDVKDALNQTRVLGKDESEYSEPIREAMAAYRAKLAEKNRIDFTGIIEQAYIQLLNPDVYHRYDGIILMSDESQDDNPVLDWLVIDLLRKRSKEFVMYASPSQEIYPFRGADYKKICETIPSYAVNEYLMKSHRCSYEIVDVAKNLAGADAMGMLSVKDPCGNPVMWYQNQNESIQARMIATKIMENKQHFISPCNTAILARSGKELNSLAKTLELYGIQSHKVGSNANNYKEEPVQRFIDYLSIAIDPDSSKCLDNIIDYPSVGVNDEVMIPIRGLSRLTWEALEKAVENPDKYDPRGVKRARELIEYRKTCREIMEASQMSVSEKVTKIKDASKICKRLYDKVDLDGMKKVDSVCSEAETFSDIRKFYEYLAEKASSSDDLLSSAVQLCTYHSSKGREWNTVILLENSNSTRVKTDRDMTIARNTAYVASTRAMKSLIISTVVPNGTPSYFNFLKNHAQIWDGRN